MRLLRKAFVNNSFLLQLDAGTLEDAFEKSLRRAVDRGRLNSEHMPSIKKALVQREKENSSTIGHATAVPHLYSDEIEKPLIIFAKLKNPIDMGAPDRLPVKFLFIFLGPKDATSIHLDTITNIARLMSDEEFYIAVDTAYDRQTLLSALARFETRQQDKGAVTNKEEDELSYTGKFCGGLKQDFERVRKFYVSHFQDGLHPKTLASTLFLFFAALAPAITFGGVMAEQTNGAIGTVEMIAATAVCGVIYALLSGQPLIILGGTGPLLIFTVILFELCSSLAIPFLPAYAWVGLWTAFFLIVFVVTDASCLMKYFTRFTDEIFAALISIIFIFEAIKALAHMFIDHKISHATALLSLLLALGTYYIATRLTEFRRSRYLVYQMREFLADFGPAIAIGAMTVVAVLLREIELPVLRVPDKFTTTSGRPWLINMFDVPIWVMVGAALPAVLMAVLVYLDQNITSRLVNSPQNKLKKGAAYHLDLLVVSGLVSLCSVFGLPWLVAATVRSLNHVRSLATTEDVTLPNGEARSHIISVRENRLSGLSIHLLVGASLLLLPLLKTIPMAVLYGLFLFMGVVSMGGNQFFERMSLWLTDTSLYPINHYIRRVPKSVIHRFTFIQFLGLAVLWIVKSSWAGIIFPLLIALLVPLRMILTRFFSQEHLEVLDAEEIPREEEMRRVD